MPKFETALEAVEWLAEMDHCILGREEARDFAEAVGLDGRSVPAYPIEHRPDLPKGARIKGATHVGQKFMLVAADELASWAARSLRLEFRECFGRGSQLRSACGALHKHFGERSDS
jgi:hypothetical protein